jgi:hypothetical protein
MSIKQYPGGIVTKNPTAPAGPYSNGAAPGIWTLDQVAGYIKQGIWPIAGNSPVDPQFNYVTMLLHGDGTNGAQNNTFLDSSINNFTITRNGNTTQGSFSPYGANWSNYSTGDGGSGSGSYLTTPSVSLSGDFTVEMWVFFDRASAYNRPFGLGNASASDGGYIFNGGYLNAKMGSVSYSGGSGVSGWNHIAFSRASGTLQIFLNGSQIASGSDSTTIAGAVSIGSYVSGSTRYFGTSQYISNLRIVNGTALYTSTFTPPTAALTAVSGTVLLTCQSNRFVDNSTNNYTITATGTPSVQRFNPFGTATAYSTSVIGGSAYFDGSGDWLNYTSSTISTSVDFTFSIWFYHIGTMSGNKGIFCSSNSRFGMLAEGGNNFYILASPSDINTSTPIPINQWNYLVITRTSGTLRAFLNGTLVGVPVSNSQSLDSFRIGSNQGGEIISNCYMSDARVLVGTGGTSITVPTAPLTAITNTDFLCSFTNGAIFDNAMMNDLETVDGAQISTSVVKYGTGSLKFDGSGDCLFVPSTPNLTLGGNFTIEFWLNLPSVASNQMIFGLGDFGFSDNNFYFRYEPATPRFAIYWGATNNITISPGLSANTWAHIAMVRSSGVVYLYVDGVSQGSFANTRVNDQSFMRIGSSTNDGGPYQYLNGYIDDFRVTNGYARYTTNFTPPTAAFFNIGPN